jgi:hypothetical protein
MRGGQLFLAVLLAFAGGFLLVRTTGGGSAAAVAWSQADLQAIGQLRVLAVRLSVFAEASGLDPAERHYAGVVPVVQVYGLDLGQAALVTTPAGRRLRLPPVALLRQSVDADPRARFDWSARGRQWEPGEAVSLPRLAELRALHLAQEEGERLELPAKARARVETLLKAWLAAGGMDDTTLEWPHA